MVAKTKRRNLIKELKMMWLKKQPPKTQAKVQQGALVLYLPQAQTPSLWRVNLADLASAQFEIVPSHQGVNQGMVLQYKLADDKYHIIAHFTDVADAQEALNKILQALFKAGAVNGGQGGSLWRDIDQSWPITRLLKWLIVLVLLFVLSALFMSIFGGRQKPEVTAAPPAPAAATTNQKPASPADLVPGQAIDADDVLQESE